MHRQTRRKEDYNGVKPIRSLTRHLGKMLHRTLVISYMTIGVMVVGRAMIQEKEEEAGFNGFQILLCKDSVAIVCEVAALRVCNCGGMLNVCLVTIHAEHGSRY